MAGVGAKVGPECAAALLTYEGMDPVTGDRPRQPRSRRLAGWGLRVLFAGVVFAVVAGVTSAILGDIAVPTRGDFRCDQPPCFDLSTPSGTTPVMMVMLVFVPLSLLAFVGALLLGIPCLLMGLIGLARGRGSAAAYGPLVFNGTLVVVIGHETLPHLLCAPFQGGFCEGGGISWTTPSPVPCPWRSSSGCCSAATEAGHHCHGWGADHHGSCSSVASEPADAPRMAVAYELGCSPPEAPGPHAYAGGRRAGSRQAGALGPGAETMARGLPSARAKIRPGPERARPTFPCGCSCHPCATTRCRSWHWRC
jgi:hypothetical protein